MDNISLLITTCNRDRFLAEALDSVREQTFPHWEAIVVNNGSSDATQHVVARYRDDRIIYIKASSNLGECAGRNLAFTHATGNYVCYLDDDDMLPPTSLAERLAFYKRYPDCGMIYGDYCMFWMDSGIWRNVPTHYGTISQYSKHSFDMLLEQADFGKKETFRLLKLFNFVRGGTPLIKRSTFETVGLFDERFLDHGDYEMWLRIASCYRIRFLNSVVYYYRIHAGSTQIRMNESDHESQHVTLLCRKYDIRESIQFHRYLDHRTLVGVFYGKIEEDQHGPGKQPLCE